MKKFFKTLITLVILALILICLVQNLGVLDFSDFRLVSSAELNSYNEYYFNNLSDEEKDMYVRIDRSVKKKSTDVTLYNFNYDNISDAVNKVMNAFFYDNPEYFYLSNTYTVTTKSIVGFNFYSIKLNYDEKLSSDEQIATLKAEIQKIVKATTNDNMTDYEKELAIHDKLVGMVKYYKYENIEDVPQIKHTAYAALIDHESVCDGYSAAYKLLLKEVGIESIIISGELGGVPHAWNIVKIDGEYYNVDTTSDDIEHEGQRHVIHAYFNLTDAQIQKSHKVDNDYNLPECTCSTYNYYNYTNNLIKESDDLYYKLLNIIKNNTNGKMIEFESDSKYKAQRIIDMLYDLNYNNWKTKRITNITYSKIDNVYIFF